MSDVKEQPTLSINLLLLNQFRFDINSIKIVI